MQLRAYQQRAVANIVEGFDQGILSALLIAPCGSGKTEMAVAVISRIPLRKWLWVVHTHALLTQSAERLRSYGLDVGVIAGGYEPNPEASVQVATVQALMARDWFDGVPPDGIVWDEVHHYEAPVWCQLRDSFPKSLRLGLTATPERDDGIGLGKSFENIVYAATYSELRASGSLVPSRLYAPTIESRGLAMDPIEAWQRYSEGRATVAYFLRIEEAKEWALRFSMLGVRSACVNSDEPGVWNDAVLEQFRSGHLGMITNVFMLTEGIDMPEIGCIILARRFQFRGTYIQATNRVLRPAPEKRDGIVLDLTGSSWKHGPPDDDFEWDLGDHPMPGRVDGKEGIGIPEDEENRKDYELPITDEGLIRVRHGALSRDDPDPDPIPLKGRGLAWLLAQRNRAILRREKELTGKKGYAVARAWGDRERRRASQFDPSL